MYVCIYICIYMYIVKYVKCRICEKDPYIGKAKIEYLVQNLIIIKVHTDPIEKNVFINIMSNAFITKLMNGNSH